MQYQKYFNQKQETRNLILEYLDNENNVEDDNYFNNLIDSSKLFSSNINIFAKLCIDK